MERPDARPSILSRSLACLCLAAPLAGAHGLPVTVNEVLTWTSHGSAPAVPGLVRLSRGAGVLEGDVLRFVCPTPWGGPEAPLMAPSGDAIYAAGLRGLARVDSKGNVSILALAPSFDRVSGRAIGSDGTHVVGLGTDGGLVRIAPGDPIWLTTLTPPPDSVVVESADASVVATGEAGRLTLDRVLTGAGGAATVTRLLDVDYAGSPTLTRISATAERPEALWVRGTTSSGYRLDRIDFGAAPEPSRLVLVAESAEPIHGPAASGPNTLVVVDGRPRRIVGDALVALSEGPRLGCLRERPGGGFLACVVAELHSYDPETGVGPAVLSVSMLRPPSLDGLDDTDRAGCKLAWSDLATDAGFAPDLIAPDGWEDPAAIPDTTDNDVGASIAASGCRVVPRVQSGGRAIVALLGGVALGLWCFGWCRTPH